MNKIWLTGRIAKDLVLEHPKKETTLCQFTIATNRPVIRDGKRETDFINCVVWNKKAENLVKFQRKGNLVGIQGELRTSTYEVNKEKKHKSYVLVETIEYLESKKEMSSDEIEDFKKMSTKTLTLETLDINEDDYPF